LNSSGYYKPPISALPFANYNTNSNTMNENNNISNIPRYSSFGGGVGGGNSFQTQSRAFGDLERERNGLFIMFWYLICCVLLRCGLVFFIILKVNS
jgi:hypothetical protein